MKQKTKKVYLQYPWAFPDSPYYKYLVENPPKGIEFINSQNQKGVITNKRKFLFLNKLKGLIRKTTRILNIPISNAHKSPKGNYDLIHCAHCLSKNQDKPWVADIEWSGMLSVSGKLTKKEIFLIRKILMKDNCKKILPWTENVKKDLIKLFPEIKEKIEVVYPAFSFPRFIKKKNKKTTILFATRYFWIKGGLIALEVYKKLQEKYKDKIELIFISDTPKEIKVHPSIKTKNIVPQKELYKLYKKSDIFFYPSMQDTFGFGLLEAMAFGVVPVTLNHSYWGTPSVNEIVSNKKTGFVVEYDNKKMPDYYNIGSVEKNLIDELYSRICLLIDNKKMREKMSNACKRKISDGRFSIKQRNKRLNKIYEGALG